MKLLSVKLKNGMDIVGVFEEEYDSYIIMSDVVHMQIDPDYGFFAKWFAIFNEGNSINLSKNDILFLGQANERAMNYYEEFLHRTLEDMDLDDMEQEMVDLYESKNQTKH